MTKSIRSEIEFVLKNRIKFIGDDEHTYLGCPEDLVGELLKAVRSWALRISLEVIRREYEANWEVEKNKNLRWFKENLEYEVKRVFDMQEKED